MRSTTSMTVPSEAAPTEVAPSPPAQPINAARKFTDLIERRPLVVLPFWIFAFFAVIWRAAHRPLWFDELFTYYIAMSPTFERFTGSILHTELNPPLNYLLVRDQDHYLYEVTMHA